MLLSKHRLREDSRCCENMLKAMARKTTNYGGAAL